ncbi:MAG: calcium-binding protein [Candidatus Binatia bacterium]
MKKFVLTLIFSAVAVVCAQAATVQVVLLGVNAERAIVEHPVLLANYEDMVSNMLSFYSNSNILVVGGGKNQRDEVTSFWRQIGKDLSLRITFVNGAKAIRNQPFSGFSVIAVTSSEAGTPSGGLTQAENDAFAERQTDLEAFLNNSGALLGFSQRGFANPYAYVPSTVGGMKAHTGQETANITPTDEGALFGLTDSLDVCCWQEEYDLSFFEVLATNAVTGNPVAVRYVGILDYICDFFPPDAIIGTEGNDILVGTPGDDVIIGLGGHDVIRGLGGNDVLCGGPGNDLLYGGDGNDRLYGGDGNDVLRGDNGNDDLFGDAGNDLLYGDRGDDYLSGGEGVDLLRGDEGDDELEGSDGNDFLFGDAGDDILDGGTGSDCLVDQKGKNSCRNGEIGSVCQ